MLHGSSPLSNKCYFTLYTFSAESTGYKRGWDKSPQPLNYFWIVEQDAVVEWALLPRGYIPLLPTARRLEQTEIGILTGTDFIPL